MTQDEIFEMAKQSDLGFLLGDSWLMHHEIEYFAKLVAQHEREIWERRCERLQSLMDIRETQPNKPCCLAEREACAKIADEWAVGWPHPSKVIALDIRARGQV
jgi:hypothetical protein